MGIEKQNQKLTARDEARLKSVYYNFDNVGAFSTARKVYEAVNKEISLDKIKEWLSGEITYTLHKPRRIKFKRNNYRSSNINDFWSVDLIDLSSLSQFNDGFKFILLVIDNFTKFVSTRALKRKSSDNVLKAFKEILFERNAKPLNLISDLGGEFFSKNFSSFLKKEKINHFNATNDTFKASLAERAIRTFKGILFKFLTSDLSSRYIDKIQSITRLMNKRTHSTTGIAPDKINDKNVLKIWNHVKCKQIKDQKRKKTSLNNGDYVRTSKIKDNFEKGYLPNYTDEIFKISRKTNRKPPVFNLVDYKDDEIRGIFYSDELQKVKNSDKNLYRIEEILDRRVNRGRNEILVRWKNFNSKHDSWISEKDLIEND